MNNIQIDNKLCYELQNGDFSNFNKLNENQQIDIMRHWNKEMWIKYCMQNTVSEEEVFDPIFRLIGK